MGMIHVWAMGGRPSDQEESLVTHESAGWSKCLLHREAKEIDALLHDVTNREVERCLEVLLRKGVLRCEDVRVQPFDPNRLHTMGICEQHPTSCQHHCESGWISCARAARGRRKRRTHALAATPIAICPLHDGPRQGEDALAKKAHASISPCAP